AVIPSSAAIVPACATTSALLIRGALLVAGAAKHGDGHDCNGGHEAESQTHNAAGRVVRRASSETQRPHHHSCSIELLD
uniref:Uncharacterized protein n=1 Tax=Aegilops tauschii subsp. strangulata TaxID=200361 RepID=A0A453D6Q3_AEGTS